VREDASLIPLRDDNPVERTPAVTILLVALNLAAFAWQVDLPSLPMAIESGGLREFMADRVNETAFRAGVVPYEILTFSDIYPRDLVPPPLTLFTSLFLHGGVAHVGSNMLFLWVFGRDVEDALGRGRFALFYVACGVAAALVQVIASAATGAVDVPVVGASGAIAGVLAAYLVLQPHARIVRVPATLLIGLWILLQVGAIVFGATGVALFAHVGGFVAGYLLVKIVGPGPTWRARRAA
jgi:membrane associated rhomboid family serine protease